MYFELFDNKHKIKKKEGEEYIQDNANKIINAPQLNTLKLENTKAIEIGAENMMEEQFIIRRMEQQNQRDDGMEMDEEFLKKHMHDIYMKRLDNNLKLLRKDLVTKQDKSLYLREYPLIMRYNENLYYEDDADYPELGDYIPIKKTEPIVKKIKKSSMTNEMRFEKENDNIQTKSVFDQIEEKEEKDAEKLDSLITPKKTKKEKREEHNSLKKNPSIPVEINEGLKKIQEDKEEEIQKEIQKEIEKSNSTDLVDMERMHPKIRDRLFSILSSSFSGGSITEEIRLQINSYLLTFNKKTIPMNVKKVQTVISVFAKNFMKGQSLNKTESKIQMTENPIFQKRESNFYVSPYKTNK